MTAAKQANMTFVCATPSAAVVSRRGRRGGQGTSVPKRKRKPRTTTSSRHKGPRATASVESRGQWAAGWLIASKVRMVCLPKSRARKHRADRSCVAVEDIASHPPLTRVVHDKRCHGVLGRLPLVHAKAANLVDRNYTGTKRVDLHRCGVHSVPAPAQ